MAQVDSPMATQSMFPCRLRTFENTVQSLLWLPSCLYPTARDLDTLYGSHIGERLGVGNADCPFSWVSENQCLCEKG